MVIGNGLIAKSFSRFSQLDSCVIFASGVSNSKTSTPENYRREHNLLLQTLHQHRNSRIVYFSTCSVHDPDLLHTTYVAHKLAMERIIESNAAAYIIFRLSNLAGFTNNPYTILNFLYTRIVHRQAFDCWIHSERNIIDVSDIYNAVNYVLEKDLFINKVINIANVKNYTVRYIINCIERFTNRKALYTEQEKGNAYAIGLPEISPVYDVLGIRFGDDYLSTVLAKYYTGK